MIKNQKFLIFTFIDKDRLNITEFFFFAYLPQYGHKLVRAKNKLNKIKSENYMQIYA